MIKKTIKYTDYNGEERTEDFFFHLNKAEAVEIEAKYPGGLIATAERISKAEDYASLVEIFKDLILKSYGEKSIDGKMFVKVDPKTGIRLADNFAQTEAYSELFTELATDAEAASKFFNGVVPNDNNKKAVPAPPVN